MQKMSFLGNLFGPNNEVRLSPSIMIYNAPESTAGNLAQLVPHGVFGRNRISPYNIFNGITCEMPCGGCLYFDNDIAREDFEALMRILDIVHNGGEYYFAVFAAASERPQTEGYLTQVRIVSRFALRFLFKTINEEETENFPEQKFSITETLWMFMQSERLRWGTSYHQDDEKGLAGVFGGDGDSAREQLSFGFAVEDSHNGVYRIWSRAWLVAQ
jgi:hypothetical protein